MSRKDLIVSIILIIFISLIFWQFSKNFKKYSEQLIASTSVLITTEKNEYKSGENLKLKITNNSGKTLCFSACYPYFLEKKDKNWESYKYVECNIANTHDGCIDNKKIKAFELTLPQVQEGLHRIAVPVCSNCKLGETFKEEATVYSNEFLIKQ